MFWAFHTHQWRTFWVMLMAYLVPPFVVLAIAVAVYLVDNRWEVIAEPASRPSPSTPTAPCRSPAG